MEKILGLDLGTNSIGWAIREINTGLENQIIDKGVLTFDKGVAEDKSGEHPMVQKRTEIRGKRRNYQGEKYRKWELLKCLIENGMCPLTIDELNDWKQYRKGIGRKYPQRKEFINWLRFDFDGDGKPDFDRLGFDKHESYYLFRKLIVDESKIEIFKKEPQIIGRVLYQLVQRRGYNDGNDIDETEMEELSKTIMKESNESGAAGADEIRPYIEKYVTLGAALYQIQKEKNVRIRKRYNLRSDYEREVKEICRVQGLERLYKSFWRAIIWQRPLRSQKGLVGICTFERNKRRCPISHPLYEEYRTWVFINNLKITPILQNNVLINSIPIEDALKTIVYPQFYKASTDFKLSNIIKVLKNEGFEVTARFPSDTKVLSIGFLYKMKELFGDDWENIIGWNDLLKDFPKKVKYNIEDLWHLLFTKTDNKKTGEKSFDIVKRFGIQKLQLTEEKAKVFAKIRLQQGYATLSLNAIKKILPYLQKGFIYSEAIYLANLPKVMGRKLEESDIETCILLIREVIRHDRYDRKKAGIVNSVIASYFEDKKNFEFNKSSIIEEQIIETYGKESWNKLSVQIQCNINDDIRQVIEKFLQEPKQKPEDHYLKAGRLHDKIFNILRDKYSLPTENIKYLWHPSEQETYEDAKYYQEFHLNNKSYYIQENKVGNFLKKNPDATKGKFYDKLLGTPDPISKGFKNPMALKTLFKLKHLINYLIEVGKINDNTRIVIELARELNDSNKRKAIEKRQREREKENETYKKQIEEINRECKTAFDPNNKDLIDKIRLWNEQNKICVYTGKTIGLCEILNGGKYDFEHSIPASMSFDNELKNLTIADKTYNQQIKGKRLPTECPNYDNNTTINGITYPSILSTMQTMFGKMTEKPKKTKGGIVIIRSFEKVEELEKQVTSWLNETKKAQTKERKDYCIQQRHYYKMELDYWRYKLQAFTIEEYKSGWRNSQLRDTQTITKYAVPFLKTIFLKVDVQKGNITSDFRKIYKIQPRLEKKERTKHSHHAIDAAVLTLIPPAAIRDKILLDFNEANEKNQPYHVKPRQWDNFHQQYVIGIEDEVLINYQAQHRTLTPTFKRVRKRGKIQYVRKKISYGKWQIKLNHEGKKISLKAKGDSIRGQLHKESLFGAIKMPEYIEIHGKFIPKNDSNGNFIFQKNEKRGDELFIVDREIDLTKFKTLEDFDIVIDPNLRAYLKKEIQSRINKGFTFSQSIIQPIYAFGKIKDKNGNSIRPIRHIRVRAKGSGSFVQAPSIIRSRNNFISEKEYKNFDYAINGEIPVCAIYQTIMNHRLVREIKAFSILEVSKSNINKKIISSVEQNIEKKVGKSKVLVPLLHILLPGIRVIFFKNELAELKDLNFKEIINRLYVVSSFEEGKIYFKHHLCSMEESEIKSHLRNIGISEKGASSLNFEHPFPKLRLSQGALNFAIEGKHFVTKPDGTIIWL
ncbi:MAG: hypothetical protein EPN37_04890 [Chitinophagaceae bacterium]|nr:MAG: hypothetical protein EPN37_04890 [Chitinophagaceae bacterium]